MTQANSARTRRAACVTAAALALVALLGGVALAAPAASSNESSRSVEVSLVQSAPVVPLGGTLGFTGVIRLPEAASSVQARLQVHRIGGRLVYQRTQYLDRAEEGEHTFSFSRPLDGLGLDVGVYPTTFSLKLTLQDGSEVTTEVVEPLRVRDANKPPVPVVLVAKVHAHALVGTDGKFAIDPASPAGTQARDQVDRIATFVTADPAARLTLAIAPAAIEEWKRFATSGYTLASGTVVPPSDPTPVAYATALAHLQQAIATGRMELATMGYSDPNFADLAENKMSSDVAPQYDLGLSAVFTALETTPSAGTVPAGGCATAAQQRQLLARHITYAVMDGERVRVGRRAGVASGAYPSADTSLTALVVEGKSSRGLESGDASTALAATFSRADSSQPQPVVLRVDLDPTSDATSSIGLGLSELEGAPWVRLVLGSQVHPPKGAKPLSVAPVATRHAPSGYWATVRTARANGTGMLAVLTDADDDANYAQTESLLSQASEWSEPAGNWTQAKTGLAYAKAAIDRANSIFDGVKISASSITLSGSSGKIPVNISNGSRKTLNVIVLVKTSTGVNISGDRAIATRLPPSETFIQIPVEMDAALFGRVTVQVMAGNVVIARQTVQVRRSYLDRLALIGGVVVLLGGMLVWIVLRQRHSPDIEGEPDDEDTDSAEEDAPERQLKLPETDDDAAQGARYTGAHARSPRRDEDGA